MKLVEVPERSRAIHANTDVFPHPVILSVWDSFDYTMVGASVGRKKPDGLTYNTRKPKTIHLHDVVFSIICPPNGIEQDRKLQ